MTVQHDQNLFLMMPGLETEEMMYLQNLTAGMSEEQLKQFLMVLQGKRKDPSQILIFTLLGLVVVAGIQRFVLGQIGMGILYLLTGGLCLIGTIIDIVNHKKMTLEFNQKQALETAQMMKMMTR